MAAGGIIKAPQDRHMGDGRVGAAPGDRVRMFRCQRGQGLGMDEDASFRAGARTAELRKIRGMTQRALASRANVSYSLLRKVETGDRPASPSFVAAVARALSVPVADLTEQPYRGGNASVISEQAGVSALRQALGEGDDQELDTVPATWPACAGPSPRSRTTIGVPGTPKRCAPCLMCCVTCTGPSTRCRPVRGRRYTSCSLRLTPTPW